MFQNESFSNSFIPSRTIVLIGLMGAGKSCIGRRLAARLHLPFVDADAEIEAAAGCSISDFFARHGEAAFREGERKVMERLLNGPPCILAAGGGAFIDATTRDLVKEKALSVWLRADLDLLVKRTAGRDHRPLLRKGDPREILKSLMDQRYPIYAEADLTVDSRDEAPDVTVDAVLSALEHHHQTDSASYESLTVDLGERSYEILIGADLLDRAGALMLPVMRQKRAFVVSDQNVAGFYLNRLLASFDAAGIAHHHAIVPAGEGTKDFTHLQSLLSAMLDAKCERGTMVVALGGGVIGDLTGFAASILLRGLDFVQIPTTLLSQVDSSVGGKTGINMPQGKNLVGSFHQPRLVLADTGVLDTLDPRQMRAGYAEIVKYGCIDDAEFFLWLEQNGERVLAKDQAALRYAVLTSCRAKARIVAADERESGKRALLNLGHTFGHALEAESGYGEDLLHGEAVSIGMVMAFHLSVLMGWMDRADLDRLLAHLRQTALPITPMVAPQQGWDVERLIAHMGNDKKVENGALTFVLARKIGAAELCRTVAIADIRRVLADTLSL